MISAGRFQDIDVVSKKVLLIGVSVLLAAFAFVRWQTVQEPVEASNLDESNVSSMESPAQKDTELERSSGETVSTQETDKPFGITFTDGERISVTLRQDFRRYPTGVTSLANEYGRLAEEALNGNVGTARYLYTRLKGCNKPDFTNEAELEAGISEFWQTGSYTTSGGKHIGFSSGGRVDQEGAEKYLRESFALCEGVDERLLSDIDKWRQFAIEIGDPATTMETIQKLPRGSPERVAMYRKAFAGGDINAAGHAAAAYRDGWDGQEPDLVKAYAYAYIYANLFQASAPKKYQQRADDMLNQIVNTMPTYQMDEAVALAKEILANSPGCCIGRPFQN